MILGGSLGCLEASGKLFYTSWKILLVTPYLEHVLKTYSKFRVLFNGADSWSFEQLTKQLVLFQCFKG